MVNMEKTASILDAKLTEKLHQPQVRGMALVVAKHGKPVFEKYYGYRDVEKKLPVTADTIFGIASITKSFAALAIMQLQDEGKLNEDDPVVKWLPEFQLPNKEFTKQVTIHHLLTHTAGLPGLPAIHAARAKSIRQDPDGQLLFDEELPEHLRFIDTVPEMMELMADMDYPLLGPPGTLFNYSNESFALLQEIIERASGMSCLQFMQEHIFAPLGMNRSTFITDDFAKLDNVTELYAYTKDKKAIFHSPAWWDVGQIYTNGSLKASARDLIAYLELYRLNGSVDGKRIVSEKSVGQMTSVQVTTPNDNQYGYGLQIDHLAGRKLVGHGGSIKGVSSNVQVVQEEGLTVAVLVNLAEVDAEELALLALKTFLDLPLEEKVKTPVYDLDKTELNPYVGHYQSLEGQQAQVEMQDGQLQLVTKNGDLPLQAYREDGFLTPDGGKIQFLRTKEKEISGMFIGMRFIEKR